MAFPLAGPKRSLQFSDTDETGKIFWKNKKNLLNNMSKIITPIQQISSRSRFARIGNTSICIKIWGGTYQSSYRH